MTVRTYPTTDGGLRRAFTVADVERMVEVGLVAPDERLEIVAGEIRPMSPKGARHEVVKRDLVRILVKALPEGIGVVPEAGWRLGDLLYLEPDLLVCSDAIPYEAVTGRDALLVVEIADTTLAYDLGPKAKLYAAEGVREYWVVDVRTCETHVFTDPKPEGFSAVRVSERGRSLMPTLLPGLRVRLEV